MPASDVINDTIKASQSEAFAKDRLLMPISKTAKRSAPKRSGIAARNEKSTAFFACNS